MPHLIKFNNKTIIDQTAMSNFFNNYSTFIAEKIKKSNIKFSTKHYTDYLSHINKNTLSLTQTNKNEIKISFNIFHKFTQIIWFIQHSSENFNATEK